MANEVAEYLSGLPDVARAKIGAIYAEAREVVPEAVEGLSYGMPSLLYKGKGLLSVMNTKKHIGIYPYGNLGELADAVAEAGLDSTKGSIHLIEDQDIPSELLAQFLLRRKAQLDSK